MANEFKVKKGLIVQGSGSTVLDIQGSLGQLFSVTDSLSGSLFSVNDMSGTPIMEVFSDNRINLGTFGAEAIKISGSTANITGSITNAISASFLSNGVVSGSSQITFSGISGVPSGLVSGSLQVTLSSTNDYSTFSSSIATTTLNLSDRIGTLETSSIGLNTYTSSIKSALEFTGSNVTVKGNLTVKGTTTTVDSTTVEIGDNIISLNGSGATNAGIIVRDATSPNLISGSLLWDTTTDKWIAGPAGSEDEIILSTKTQTLTNKTLNGTLNTITNIGNSSLTNSSITIAGTSVSLGGSISSSTILSGTNVWSGSAQLPSGLVSGSSQITISGTTGFGSYINQSLLTTSSPSFTNLTIGTNQVLHAGNYNNYAPTKTGTGASGTWGISITGNSATATNLANGSAGTIPYQTSAGTTAMLAAGTSGYFLKSNNTSAPSWVELSLTDLPDSWVKKSVKVATTTNITLSGTTTIDGVAVVAGDRVLVKNQTTTSQNGIYIVNSSTWTRSTDADTISKLSGTVVNVDNGTSNGGLKFITKLKITDTLGSTAVNFYKVIDETDLSGYVTTGRTLTINGITQDLSTNRTFNVGTVTSVSATSPLSSTGGNTPTISIQQANGSQGGFLSSTDWNTFNNKQNALTNPITGTGTTNYLPKFLPSGTIGNSLIYDNGTNISIGDTTTGSRLGIRAQGTNATDIVLNVRSSDGTKNFLVVNGAGDVYNYGANGESSNLFFGENIGRLATGVGNVGFGSQSFRFLSTGTYNSALGYQVLASLTTGSENTAFGQASLQLITTSTQNTAIGRASFPNLTSGNQNTAIGNNSGRFIADGTTPLSGSTLSVFLGYNTKASANGVNNEIVIGSDAIGNGSNSVTLGNDSITKTILKGNVGIGTTSPSYKLDVVGDIRTSQTIYGGSSAPAGTSYSTYVLGGGTGSYGAFSFYSKSDVDADSFGTVSLGAEPESGVYFVSSNLDNSKVSQLSFDPNTFTLASGGDINFKTKPSTLYQTSFIIKASGYVGIGTTSPSEKLEVNGNIHIQENFKILGNKFGEKREMLSWNTTSQTLRLNYGFYGPDSYNGIENYGYTHKWIGTGDYTQMYIDGSGNVGIGTTSPSSYKLNVNGDTNINGTLTATVKSFIIDHPTKSNKKLQYGVLEGPEHSVYFRGKLKGTNKIILPDYWFALVNKETITVNITPIGDKQNIWVVTTNAREIILESETEINCFYTVFAERKDIDKLVTEFDK